jgi:Txe/YoeB family toxin of Txe-Axe toxin-antitoxin module
MENEETARLREGIRAATRKYRRTEKAHKEAQEELIRAIVEGLRGGVRPTEVEEDSPFRGAYIRRIREEHRIPAFKKGQPPVASDG